MGSTIPEEKDIAESGELWLAPLVLIGLLVLVPVWGYVSYHNHYVQEVLYSGWTPVIGAMVISSAGGLILDYTVSNFLGIAVFQPVINGVGGNLVAVQASRLSTSLHFRTKPGQLPEGAVHGCPNPCRVFCNRKELGPVVLLMMVVPGQLLFIYIIYLVEAGHVDVTLLFCLFYLLASLIQVAILLYICVWMVHLLWKWGRDPDNFSIPYLTALGDLIGTGLLAAAFYILHYLGDQELMKEAPVVIATNATTFTPPITTH